MKKKENISHVSIYFYFSVRLMSSVIMCRLLMLANMLLDTSLRTFQLLDMTRWCDAHSHKFIPIKFSFFACWWFRILFKRNNPPRSTNEHRRVFYFSIFHFCIPFVFNFANLLSKCRKHMAHSNGTYSIHTLTPFWIKANEYCHI